ncbi:RHO4 protein [Cystobasidiomycetes sp. EMM_F5]
MDTRYLEAARSQYDTGYDGTGQSQGMASQTPTASSRGSRNGSSSMGHSNSSDGAIYYDAYNEGSGGSALAGAAGGSATPRRVDCARKLVVVGDGGCGKTCLLTVYCENRFPEAYIPTVFENLQTKVTFENKIIELALWDTAGQEDYDRLRPLSYPECNVLLICFAVDYPTSLENVTEKWFPEVDHFCPGVPIVLVGTKTDLRQDQRTRDLLRAQGRDSAVTAQEATLVAQKIGARYVECSAKTGQGVKQVFDIALKEAMKSQLIKKIRKKTNCKIL